MFVLPRLASAFRAGRVRRPGSWYGRTAGKKPSARRMRVERLEARTVLSGGVVLESFGPDSRAFASFLANDDQIVVAGGSNAFASLRFQADGTLDPSFGTEGVVTTNFTWTASLATSVAPSGEKIVAGGLAGTSSYASADFGLVRYNADGSRDKTFNYVNKKTFGMVQTDLGGNDRLHDIVVLDDGSIIAAGSSNRSGAYRFTLVRYTSSGRLDSGFGSGGIVQTTIGDRYDEIHAVTLHDGKILAVGSANNGDSGTGEDFALARYNLDGTLDETFGTAGVVVTDFHSVPDESITFENAYAVAVDATGRILVAGALWGYTIADNVGYDMEFALARYNPDGSLDESFGYGGLLITDFGENDQANAVTIQADGKIVAAGWTDYDARKFAVARYNEDGSPDAGFGTDGKVITPILERAEAHSVVVQSDQSIVVSGYARGPASPDPYVALVCYRPDGTLDPDFGAPSSLPALSIRDQTSFEGNSGTTAFNVTVSLSSPSDVDVTVHYTTQNGTAVAGSDYLAASGVLTIPAGQWSATITVWVNGDTGKESDEKFYVNLTAPVGATIADTQAVATIRNDDSGGKSKASSASTILSAETIDESPRAGAPSPTMTLDPSIVTLPLPPHPIIRSLDTHKEPARDEVMRAWDADDADLIELGLTDGM